MTEAERRAKLAVQALENSGARVAHCSRANVTKAGLEALLISAFEGGRAYEQDNLQE